MVVKAEIGVGFSTEDASSGINSESIPCYYNRTHYHCDFNIFDVARHVVPAIHNTRYKTLRVETICSCPEGYEILPDANDECVPCAFGEYRESSMSSCEAVQAGTYSNNERQRADCDRGTFTDYDGAAVCDDCPAGYYNLEPASTNCLQCQAGTISPSPGWGVLCQYCDPGHEPNVEQTACIPCSPGSANPGIWGLCMKCDVGTFNNGNSYRL
jgi:hypothetical protein